MASPSMLASCARVYKRWKEPALDMLWMDISDLHVLFQLLAPMELDDGTWKFSSAETPLQFEYKKAEDDGDDEDDDEDEDEDPPPLGISEDTWTAIARFLQQCASKSPGLKKFILQTQLNVSMVQNELSSFLQSLPGLEMIMLPYFTPWSHQLLTAISHLPNLRRLEMLVWSSVIEEIPPIDNTLFDGTFPALTEVDLYTRLDDIQHVLQNPSFPCTLKTLVIQSVPPITLFLLQNMISQILKLNILEGLQLDLCPSPSSTTEMQDIDVSISFETLSPIIQF
ncbi:hypothetical protein M422DRAFT_253900 [Sphaerobolus stellatus SS14]|uniref:F-box domain-containing protein n=1 Tax=Sphaerobolus stellatus (strain SS14) TaxID=990650 RepID=A0A0C9UIC1_SPHS4|nr:hypothetical protein M422DRAFT_253900 [Sphaerobolus stellatus SS14]